MKKFKNIDNFKDAEAFLKANFKCPIFSANGELSEEYNDLVHPVLEQIYFLFQDAKNVAVRAAIHKILIGGAMIDYSDYATGTPYYSTDEWGNVNYLCQSVECCMSFRPIEPDGNGGTQYGETIGPYCYKVERTITLKDHLDEYAKFFSYKSYVLSLWSNMSYEERKDALISDLKAWVFNVITSTFEVDIDKMFIPFTDIYIEIERLCETLQKTVSC